MFIEVLVNVNVMHSDREPYRWDLNVFWKRLRIWEYILCWNPTVGRPECIVFTKTAVTSIDANFFYFTETYRMIRNVLSVVVFFLLLVRRYLGLCYYQLFYCSQSCTSGLRAVQVLHGKQDERYSLQVPRQPLWWPKNKNSKDWV